ncbi:abc-type transport permease component [Leptolyngbya sp. Heron Island J]|uniref:exopolysaccharide biosynthesis protein n=1 Tax=Leptolyngbya sp. Heron Island J TaxID=1385935 RepID=UPI0003B9657C|nr:exopolysaccharide biosynthesis protein [Leptolyngbya sp. Heron Island J]ESA38358.1 abc-type transport permease component [Leptolyngbya sp. Heron Island J]
MNKLSSKLQRYFLDANTVEDHPIGIEELFFLMGKRTFGCLFVLFILPLLALVSIQPSIKYSVLLILCLGAPLRVMILLLALQLAFGFRQPWLPYPFRRFKLKRSKLQEIVKLWIPWLQKLELFSKPRLTLVSESLPGRILIGLAMILMILLSITPVPGIDGLTLIGAFVTSFGLINRDGLISLGGLILGAFGGLLTARLLLFGFESWPTVMPMQLYILILKFISLIALAATILVFVLLLITIFRKD